MIHRISLETVATFGDERPSLASDEAQRRRVVRATARVARSGLLLFRADGARLDVVVRAPRPLVLARALRQALGPRGLGPDLEPPFVREVETRSHLLWLVKHLLAPERQAPTGGPSTLWTGTCLADLLSARVLPGFDPRALRVELPRLRPEELLVHAGLPPALVRAATRSDLARAGPARLAELAATVMGIGPGLGGRSDLATGGRALAVHVGVRVGFRPPVMAEFLGVTVRAVRKMAERPPPPGAVLAVARRLTLEEHAVHAWLRAS